MKKRFGVGSMGILVPAACLFANLAAQAGDAKTITIGFLLPCTKCADRFEQKDRSFFIDSVAKIDPSIKVIVTNAEGDTARQLAQGEAALARGDSVLVVIPIEERPAAAIVDMAHRQHTPVLAYDGMIKGALPDAYISFDNRRKFGELQAQYAVDHIPPGGSIALINGDQTCDPCRAFKRGAHAVLDPLAAAGKIKLVYEADAKDWLASNAQREVEQALTATDDRIDAIVAANDTLAQGVIAALKARKLNGMVVVTGQDASNAAIEHILLGDQTMTVYKDLRAQAAAAAKGAVALAKGEDIASLFPRLVANDKGEIAELLLAPVVVERSDVAETVIRSSLERSTTSGKAHRGESATFDGRRSGSFAAAPRGARSHQALWAGRSPEGRRHRGPCGFSGRAARRQRRRQIHLREDHRGRASAGQRRDLVRPPEGEYHVP